jgi:hypothetical protein
MKARTTFWTRPPLRGGRENDELPFEQFMDGSTEVPGFVKDVTNRFLHAEPGLGQRATNFGRGLAQPAEHRLASGSLDGFRSRFNGKTHDITAARVLQEDLETGAMFAVKVGAENTQMGLMSLYSDERDRLESIGHPDVAAIRRLMSWFMEKCMQYSGHKDAARIMKALLKHDQKFRENCARATVFTVCESTLNSSWAVYLGDLAMSSTAAYAPHHGHQPYGNGGGRGRGGGGGGGRAGRGHQNGRGQGGRQGGGRNGAVPVCNDFARGNCARPHCNYKH